MFNLVVLTGMLTFTPELKTTPSGISVTRFSIAVQRSYTQGEERQTDFINIVAWRGTAEFICRNFTQGSLIGIEGSIQTNRYQDKDGKKRTSFEVIANNVQFVLPKGNQMQQQDINVSKEDVSNTPDEEYGDTPF